MVFKPGQSGNPSGRRSSELKSIIEARELAVQAGPSAIRTIIEIMNSDLSSKTRLDAANKILDRGLGRPIQFMDINTNDNVDPKNMTKEELMLYLSGNTVELVKKLRDSGKLKKCLEELDNAIEQSSQKNEFQHGNE